VDKGAKRESLVSGEQPHDSGSAGGWTRSVIIAKLAHAEDPQVEEVHGRVIANRGWAI
jgi:hypothetical protein